MTISLIWMVVNSLDPCSKQPFLNGEQYNHTLQIRNGIYEKYTGRLVGEA